MTASVENKYKDFILNLVLSSDLDSSLEAFGIDFHYNNYFNVQIQWGMLGLMMGELLADRYQYEEYVSPYRIDKIINVDIEKKKLLEIDEKHPGPEHGARRHYVNELMVKQIPSDCHLLDYGAGSGWYKEYYSKCKSVTATDLNLNALKHLRSYFPDQNKYKLIWVPFGITDLPDKSFDCIILSAVIGYMTQSMANLLLNECVRLLSPRGKIICALIPSYGFSDWILRRSGCIEVAPGAFHYKYTSQKLKNMLQMRGLNVVHHSECILKIPKQLRKSTNRLYRYETVKLLDGLILKLVKQSTWHMFVAEK